MTSRDDRMTERLRLRPVRHEDESFVAGLLTHVVVREYLGGPVPAQRLGEATERHLSIVGDERVWLVETIAHSQPIGVVSLTPHKDGQDIEVSYQLHTDAWGRGYATEAIQAVLQYAFEERKLEKVIAETQSANVRSCRLLERVGMRREHTLLRFGAMQSIYVARPPDRESP